jgi:echinoderm microtubule-associated protein-like 6
MSKTEGQFATCSDDGTMRLWDCDTHKMISIVNLNLDKLGKQLPPDPTTKELNMGARARAVDLIEGGDKIAVGFRDGSVRIYNGNMDYVTDIKKLRKRWICEVKYSPDNKYLAVASHDAKVDIYEVRTNNKLGTLGKSSSFITAMDWSESGDAIVTNDSSYEVLYYRALEAKQDTYGATNYRDEMWASCTTMLAWGSIGIWEKGYDGSDINAVDRSNLDHDGY